MKFSALSLAALMAVSTLLFSGQVAAQSRSETRQYKSTVAKGDLKSYDKFLSKHPNSIYSPKIMFLKDSLLYSAVNKEDLKSILLFLNHNPSTSFAQQIKERAFEMAYSQRHVLDNTLVERQLIDSVTIVTVGSGSYFHYSYENFNSNWRSDGEKYENREYVTCLMDLKSGALFSAMFAGKMKFSENGESYMEGESMDKLSNSAFATPEMAYLLAELGSNSSLVQISESNLLADQAIEWWYKENSGREKNLSFGLLPNESAIVQMFNTSKDIERGKKYNVAFFDVRDNTVVCAYQKSSKQFILVWCEKPVVNKTNEKYLNTIYFENDNTLVLYYYKGNRTFKVRINLATKVLS